LQAPESVLVKSVDLKVYLEELSFFLAHAEG
jgi:NADH/NAD ratio-sensing transcriptional regulator Rex